MTAIPTGGFNWHELMTTDTAKAKAFYEAVTGLRVGGGDYPMFMDGDLPVGGLVGPREGKAEWPSGSGPHWVPYIGVKDVDAAVAKAKAMGGKVFLEPMDVPNWGRVAGLRDPQGAVFGVYKPA